MLTFGRMYSCQSCFSRTQLLLLGLETTILTPDPQQIERFTKSQDSPDLLGKIGF